MFEVSAKTIVKTTILAYITYSFVHGVDVALGERINPKLRKSLKKLDDK
jgi:hypothetical protein